MKDEWYSDNRDLVKWGVLLQLVELHKIATILQVAYYRPSLWDQKRIEVDGVPYRLPPQVVAHLRSIKNIEGMTSRPRVHVLEAPFDNRDDYLDYVLREMQRLRKGRTIVFLDPDTGLQPPKAKAGLEHVLASDLQKIWNALRQGDLLVFYQHSSRSQSWMEDKQAQFEDAIGLERGSSGIAHAREIANNVVFFFSERLDSVQTAQAAK
jgi:hypothetical protein